jgi:hypothetical protein
MTEEQQRIAIAEACGWTPVQCRNCKPSVCTCDTDKPNPNTPPDYLNDLNAIHDATMILGIQQLCEMADWLHQITGFHTRIFHAPAAQRAEAFLRTIGKWEEAQ